MDKTEARGTPVYQGIKEKHGKNRSTGYKSLPWYNRAARTKPKHEIHKLTRV
jgi:hypothetical protein